MNSVPFSVYQFKEGHEQMLECLLSHGADVHLTDFKGRTGKTQKSKIAEHCIHQM